MQCQVHSENGETVRSNAVDQCGSPFAPFISYQRMHRVGWDFAEDDTVRTSVCIVLVCVCDGAVPYVDGMRCLRSDVVQWLVTCISSHEPCIRILFAFSSRNYMWLYWVQAAKRCFFRDGWVGGWGEEAASIYDYYFLLSQRLGQITFFWKIGSFDKLERD